MENVTQQNASTDIFDQSAGDIDLSRPIAPASNYQMLLTEPKIEPNRKGTGNNLVVKWKSTTEIMSTKGDVINPGALVITQYIGLTETEKRKSKAIAQDIARLIRGGGLPVETKISEVMANPTLLAGKTMLVKVKIRQETTEFPESNEIGGIVLEG
jgi:hypothetical protein